MKLRHEIDADLAAGRISQLDYDFCKRRIESELQRLDEPLPPGQTIRVIGLPRKMVDWDQVAGLFLRAAEDQLRRERGEPPLTDAERRDRDVLFAQAAREVKQQRQAAEQQSDRQYQTARRRFARRKPGGSPERKPGNGC